jgi:hypothetical protein
VTKAPKKGSPTCNTPAPTPFSPFVLYAAGQRCLEARPWYTFQRRMLHEDSGAMAAANAQRFLGPADSLDECFRACFSTGLHPTYYFAVANNECYSCDTW